MPFEQSSIINSIKTTIYIDTYTDLRKCVLQHLETGEYKDNEKRKQLAQQFYDAEDQCYNIEERELYEYLNGCADPIKHSDYIFGDEYIEFLQDIIKTFNDVLPNKINIPKVQASKP